LLADVFLFSAAHHGLSCRHFVIYFLMKRLQIMC